MDAAETLPYWVVNVLAFSPTYCSIARRSFKSSNNMPLSSAMRNTIFKTPVCVSFKSSMRDNSKGPISLIVARTGWPFSPNTSHSVVGAPCQLSGGKPKSFRRALTFSLSPPACEIPVKSPLTSAINTGTPRLTKCCAKACKLTVLPVPVAPVIKPWRLPICGKKLTSVVDDLPITIGSAMRCAPWVDRLVLKAAWC